MGERVRETLCKGGGRSSCSVLGEESVFIKKCKGKGTPSAPRLSPDTVQALFLQADKRVVSVHRAGVDVTRGCSAPLLDSRRKGAKDRQTQPPLMHAAAPQLHHAHTRLCARWTCLSQAYLDPKRRARSGLYCSCSSRRQPATTWLYSTRKAWWAGGKGGIRHARVQATAPWQSVWPWGCVGGVEREERVRDEVLLVDASSFFKHQAITETGDPMQCL